MRSADPHLRVLPSQGQGTNGQTRDRRGVRVQAKGRVRWCVCVCVCV